MFNNEYLTLPAVWWMIYSDTLQTISAITRTLYYQRFRLVRLIFPARFDTGFFLSDKANITKYYHKLQLVRLFHFTGELMIHQALVSVQMVVSRLTHRNYFPPNSQQPAQTVSDASILSHVAIP